MPDIRVRFAPSPTGFLHIGGLRTLLFNYLFAKKHGGKLILRIEDTDRTRFVEGAVDNLLRTIEWAGLDYDEGIHKEGDVGPYVQSERLHLYKKYVQELVGKGRAYYAFDTAEELDVMRKKQQENKLPPMYDRVNMKNSLTLSEEETQKLFNNNIPFVVRLKIEEGRTLAFQDMVRGKVSFQTSLIDDQILLKSDGFPTYHLAVVVDDHLMNISHVIRGEEWLSSTPKHILLYEAFGWDIPEFAHLPLLLNADRSKLSKRTGDVAVEVYRDKGYLPEALLNFIVLLGWNPKTEQEKMSLAEMIQLFDLTKVHKSGAVTDFKRLNWFNGQYIRSLSQEAFLAQAKPWITDAGTLTEGQLSGVIVLEQERLENFSELPDKIRPFTHFQGQYPAEALVWKKATREETISALEIAEKVLQDLSEEHYTREGTEKALKEAQEKYKLASGTFFWPLRYALSGSDRSPAIFEMLEALGKTWAHDKIALAREKLSQLS